MVVMPKTVELTFLAQLSGLAGLGAEILFCKERGLQNPRSSI
jgi:hypothetical protein